MDIELAGARRTQWGEGPIWWQDGLYYVDIEGHKVIHFDARTGEDRTWDVRQRVGTVVPRKRGGWVIAGDHGVGFLDPGNGEVTHISDPEADKPDNRFNDGKCSPDGRFFAGTLNLARKQHDAALYRLDPDLALTKVLGGVSNSNGIVWTEDGETVFYIDTPTRIVTAFDYETASGSLSNQRVAFRTGEVVDASPDGMAIDRDGHLWIAFCHGACVVCFNQEGRELRRIDFPCREVTAVAFGGEGLRDLYVTSGIPGKDVEEHAGRLFVVRDLGVEGLPAHSFGG